MEPASVNESSSRGRQVLHFGAMVYLCFENEMNEEYVACAEGFTKNKIRLKQVEAMEENGSFSEGLFRIFPLFYNTEYLKTKHMSN